MYHPVIMEEMANSFQSDLLKEAEIDHLLEEGKARHSRRNAPDVLRNITRLASLARSLKPNLARFILAISN